MEVDQSLQRTCVHKTPAPHRKFCPSGSRIVASRNPPPPCSRRWKKQIQYTVVAPCHPRPLGKTVTTLSYQAGLPILSLPSRTRAMPRPERTAHQGMHTSGHNCPGNSPPSMHIPTILLVFVPSRYQFGKWSPCFGELCQLVFLTEIVIPHAGVELRWLSAANGSGRSVAGSVYNDWVGPDGMELRRFGAGC